MANTEENSEEINATVSGQSAQPMEVSEDKAAKAIETEANKVAGVNIQEIVLFNILFYIHTIKNKRPNGW